MRKMCIILFQYLLAYSIFWIEGREQIFTFANSLGEVEKHILEMGSMEPVDTERVLEKKIEGARCVYLYTPSKELLRVEGEIPSGKQLEDILREMRKSAGIFLPTENMCEMCSGYKEKTELQGLSAEEMEFLGGGKEMQMASFLGDSFLKKGLLDHVGDYVGRHPFLADTLNMRAFFSTLESEKMEEKLLFAHQQLLLVEGDLGRLRNEEEEMLQVLQEIEDYIEQVSGQKAPHNPTMMRLASREIERMGFVEKRIEETKAKLLAEKKKIEKFLEANKSVQPNQPRGQNLAPPKVKIHYFENLIHRCDLPASMYEKNVINAFARLSEPKKEGQIK